MRAKGRELNLKDRKHRWSHEGAAPTWFTERLKETRACKVEEKNPIGMYVTEPHTK